MLLHKVQEDAPILGNIFSAANIQEHPLLARVGYIYFHRRIDISLDVDLCSVELTVIFRSKA